MFSLLSIYCGCLLSILLLTPSVHVQSQYLEIDSMERLLGTELHDSVRVRLLYQISRDLVYVDPVRALQYAKESEQLSLKLKSRLDQAYAYRALSSIYASQEFYSLATEIGLKAYHIFQEEGDSVGLANYYITNGNLYRIQKLYEKAAEYHAMSLKYFQRHGPDSRYAITALNYGEALYYLDSLNKSIQMQRIAIRINNKNNNMLAQTFSYKAMGLVYMKLEQYDSAEYYFNEAIDISDKLGKNSQKEATLVSMIQLASLYGLKGREKEQLALLEEAELFADKFNRGKHLTTIYLQLLELSLNRNNSKAAARYLSKFQSLEDSLNNSTAKDREAMLGTLYNTMKIGVENQYLADQQNYSAKVIYEQKVYLVVMAALGVISIIAMAFVIINRNKLKKSVRILNVQKEEIRRKSEELKGLNDTKDKMFSIVSHDLRSPLLSLLGFADMVSSHINEISKKEIVEIMNQLKDNVDATLKMTNNLIQWGMLQMEQATVIPTYFDVNIIINELVEVYKNTVEQKGLQLEVNTGKPCLVYADYDQTELIIRNLLNNAIKFTEEGGKVIIATATEEPEATIKIKDTGLGIDKELMANLFKLKATSTTGTKGEKGSGLGLILCHEYAIKNNGKITVESTLGEGSTFELILPTS